MDVGLNEGLELRLGTLVPLQRGYMLVSAGGREVAEHGMVTEGGRRRQGGREGGEPTNEGRGGGMGGKEGRGKSKEGEGRRKEGEGVVTEL